MKNKLFYFTGLLSITLLLSGFVDASAQQVYRKNKRPPVSGISFLNGGKIGDQDTISVRHFDSLLFKKLVVRDSSGHFYTAHSFNFVYACRGVYSDSTGRPIIQTNYLYSQSTNGLLPGYWRKALLPQVKAGDTAIFTDIRYRNDRDTAKTAPLLYGKTFRVILTP